MFSLKMMSVNLQPGLNVVFILSDFIPHATYQVKIQCFKREIRANPPETRKVKYNQCIVKQVNITFPYTELKGNMLELKPIFF